MTTEIKEHQKEKRWQLYRVNIKARPLPGHPQYWLMEFGCLIVWLFGQTNEDAATRAVTIAETLNLDLIGTRVGTCKIEGPSTNPEARAQEKSAAQTGFAAMLIRWPVGDEEDGFFDTDKFL